MRRWATPLLALGLILGSCGGTSQDRLAYALGEFFVSGSEAIAHGTMEIPAVNEGDFPHTLVITTREGAVVAATDLIPPGVEATPPSTWRLGTTSSPVASSPRRTTARSSTTSPKA